MNISNRIDQSSGQRIHVGVSGGTFVRPGSWRPVLLVSPWILPNAKLGFEKLSQEELRTGKIAQQSR